MSGVELKTLGRYTIARVLGKGAMGVVYEGFDPRLNRKVAIKTILKGHLDEATAKNYSMRFVREARAVARLNHPNIVQVHDFGEEGEVAYLIMEFIRGRELKTFFDANERFDLKEVVRIMGELCDALEFAHQAGVIHRDVKPGNVMLDSQTRAKLTDFGVARVQDVGGTHTTQGGTMVGTPAYMSPEQITGGTIDRRTDVFSAGIVLYQFLTGDMPFTGGGAWTITKKIMQDEPALPSSINTSISPLFDAVVSKALAKDPAQRYQSARALGIALKRALEGKPEEDEADKTVVRMAAPAPKPAAPSGKAPVATPSGIQDAEVEFWRSIKDGSDPHDFELYVEQFPNGIYTKLAWHKISKLRGLDTGTDEPVKAVKVEPIPSPEAEAAREAEQRAWREAEEKARREANEETKREAEARAGHKAEQKSHVIPPAKKRPASVAAVVIAAVIATVGGSIWFMINQSTTPPPAAKVAETRPAAPPVVVQPAKPNASEQKAAEEKAAAEKATKDKEVVEKLASEKAASEKAAQEKAAAEQKAAERATARKEAAERAASEKAAAAKLAEEKAAAERAAAIEQERRAPFRPFEGKWKTPSGSILEIKEGGQRLLGFSISPSAAAAKVGYRAGQTLLEADLVAPGTLRGIFFLRLPQEYRQCLNVEVARYAMTASLSDNSNALYLVISAQHVDSTCKFSPFEHKETWTRTN